MVISCYVIDDDCKGRKISFPEPKKSPEKISQPNPSDTFQKVYESSADKKDEQKINPPSGGLDIINFLLTPFKFLILAWHLITSCFKTCFDDISLLSPEARFRAYEKDHNGDVFNKYLPYRSSITDDKEQLEDYEEKIRIVLSKADIKYADKPRQDKNYCIDYEDLKQPRAGECYLIAAYLVDVCHNRFDLVKDILNSTNGLKVRLVKDIKVKETRRLENGEEKEVHLSIGGFYDENENVAVLCIEDLWSNNLNPHDGYNLVLHELLGHGADAIKGGSDTKAKCNGIIEAMTEDQIRELTEARDELISIYENYRKNLSPDELKKANERPLDPKTGLRNYAFKKDPDNKYVEFPSVILETFWETPEVLYKASKKLYDVYKNFFGVDPLEIQSLKIAA